MVLGGAGKAGRAAGGRLVAVLDRTTGAGKAMPGALVADSRMRRRFCLMISARLVAALKAAALAGVIGGGGRAGGT